MELQINWKLKRAKHALEKMMLRGISQKEFKEAIIKGKKKRDKENRYESLPILQWHGAQKLRFLTPLQDFTALYMRKECLNSPLKLAIFSKTIKFFKKGCWLNRK